MQFKKKIVLHVHFFRDKNFSLDFLTSGVKFDKQTFVLNLHIEIVTVITMVKNYR